MIKLIKDLVALVFSLVEVLLIFRFVLRLLSANAGTPLVSWIYETTRPLLRPFLLVFPSASLGRGFTLEFTTLLAILAYAIIGYFITQILEVMAGKSK